MNKKINLEKILKKHDMWLKGKRGGIKADFSDMELAGVDFSGADLSLANLSGANLSGANLSLAILRGADLSYTDLSGASLRGASLRGASLSFANLNGADLNGSDLSFTNLNGIRSNSLTNFARATNIPYIPMACPDHGEYTAFKKVRGNFIVVLKIPEDAKRSSSTGRKCRADKAMVLRIESLDGKPAPIDEIASLRDPTFVYKVGETVYVPNFDENRFRECAPGIHHFINRQEAVNYRL